MKMEEAIRTLEARRSDVDARLCGYLEKPGSAFYAVTMAHLEGERGALAQVIYLLHLVNSSGRNSDGSL